MKKKQGIIVLILAVVFTALLIFTSAVGFGPTGTGAARNIILGLDLSGGVSITYQAKEDNPSAEDMSDTIYKLQQRVEGYSEEAQVYQEGNNRINIEIPGVSDANAILEELGKPGSLEFTDPEGNVVLDGTDVAEAEGGVAQDDTGNNQYVVSLQLTTEGTKKFAEATEENLGQQISIVYDGEVISAPVVQSVISDGRAQITGMESIEEAKNLASTIRIGALSLELEEVYSNVVGAQLGQDALATSVTAGVIGLLIVCIFMIFVYRMSGLAAAWALVVFAFLDLIFLNAFDITLTLPGIAGVVLTIGMAVDANVIIYARMREELTAGKSIRSSIQAGFHKAFSAIFDGNITTLIAAAVLYALGNGSIRGFAVTLAIGVILSMFSSLAVSRWLSYAFYGLGARSEKLYGKIKIRKPFNFVGKRHLVFVLSALLVLSAPVGLAVYQARSGQMLNFSLDFIGGTATTVDFGEEMSLSDLDEKVQPVVSGVTGDNNIQFQKVKDTSQVIIKTRELDSSERETLNSALAENFSQVDASSITAENISATMSTEMRRNAVMAVVIAVILMLIYIWIRFRDIRFASSAILALLHDVIVVLAFYAWFRYSVGNTFIAVMLTILGYSINSTIVIFDRIRENLPAMKEESLRTVVNTSITQTLTRTLYSSLTTFITIFVLFLMGVPAVREFALPIIIGIVCGAYTSVCLTGALWYVMKTKLGKNRVADREPAAALPEKKEEEQTESREEKAAPKSGAAARKKAEQGEKRPLQSTRRKKHRRKY